MASKNGQRTAVAVFVPAEGHQPALDQIAPGSAIVGAKDSVADRRIVDFEGNVFASPQLDRFADRVHHAAGRFLQRYPTQARMGVSAGDLVQIGEYDGDAGKVRLLSSRARGLLAAWLGTFEFDQEELEASGYRFELQRQIVEIERSPDPANRQLAQWMRRRFAADL